MTKIINKTSLNACLIFYQKNKFIKSILILIAKLYEV